MAEAIGTITIVHGLAQAIGPDGSRDLKLGDPVFEDDTVVTGDGDSALEIRFNDATILSQGADSKVVLDEYTYDDASGMGELLFDMAQGTFRSVTGTIADNNPEGFQMDTPLSHIGIRGTVTAHDIPAPGEGGEETHALLVFHEREVEVTSTTVEGQANSVLLGTSGQSAVVGSMAPPQTVTLSRAEYQYYQQLSSSELGRQAPRFESPEEIIQDDPQAAEPVSQQQLDDARQEADQEDMLHRQQLGEEVEMRGNAEEEGTDEELDQGAQQAANEADENLAELDELLDGLSADGSGEAEEAEDEGEDVQTEMSDLSNEDGAAQTADVTLSGNSGTDLISGTTTMDLSATLSSVDSLSTAALMSTLGSVQNVITAYNNLIGGFNADLMNDADFVNEGPPPPENGGTWNNIYGTNGNDTALTGTTTTDQIWGLDGNDIIEGKENDDRLFGGNGDDTLYGHSNGTAGTGNDEFIPGAGNDTIFGGGEYTAANGNWGDSIIYIPMSTDSLIVNLSSTVVNLDLDSGSAGNEVSANGGQATYTISATAYTDTLNDIENINGSNNADTLIGDASKNRIMGENGNDFIYGRGGGDELEGGSGSDTFHYETTGEGSDEIKDFVHGTDTIQFQNSNFFGSNSGGDLDSAYFIKITDPALYSGGDGSTGGQTTNHFYVYAANNSGGYDLYYDANGNLGGGQELIATFSSDVNLDHTDIAMTV